MLTIGFLIFCLTLHYSVAEGFYIRKRHKFYLMGVRLSHKNKAIEEVYYDDPRYDFIEEIYDVDKMRGSILSN